MKSAHRAEARVVAQRCADEVRVFLLLPALLYSPVNISVAFGVGAPFAIAHKKDRIGG